MERGLDPLERLRPARALIDLDRLAANYAAVAAHAGRPVMPVVKADAYGHGAAVVARHLERLGAPMLAVAYAEEGAALRRSGVSVPILVMAGFGPAQAGLLVENGLVPVVSSPETLAIVCGAAQRGARPLEVHLKVDTGMTRLGFDGSLAGEAAERLRDAGLSVVGLMTQLAAADEDPEFSALQLDRLDGALALLERRGIRPAYVHAANSAGLQYLRPSHTLVRPGLILYGLKPRPLAPEIAVRPVMSVSARIGLVRDVAKGQGVSYGRRWIAQRPSRVAVIPIGYADGVPRTRAMSARGAWLIEGRRAPVAGTVCMDLSLADVTEIAAAAVGSEAVLFGDEPSAWDVAECAGSNAWHALTSIGARVPRIYLAGGRAVALEARYA